MPPRLRQSQDKDDSSGTRRNNHCIERNGENIYTSPSPTAVPLPSREDGHVIPAVLPSEIRHAIMSVRNRTAAGPDRIKPEHQEPSASTHQHPGEDLHSYLRIKVPKQWKTSKTVLLYKRRST
ncbi:hypothetical protein RB195_010999 [Necator americanus]|uniref:Uncharacterized protein n=1 Tax=Necator americanus TaxID=51031 RepID=A0ABR1D278_NECAM